MTENTLRKKMLFIEENWFVDFTKYFVDLTEFSG